MIPPTPPADSAAGAAPKTGPHLSPAAYLTQDIPGTGGTIKQRPEDFLVDEMPAYQPSGEGEHIYLFVEKRNLSTLEAARIIAGHFGVDPESIGYAGMKDKVAITRQLFSVHTPGKAPEDFPRLEHERLEVQWADRHNNKLRLGHLEGNRFSIRIRDVGIGQVRHARAALDRLATVGIPNRFGPQRFGRAANNHLVGRALIRGEFDEAVRLLVAPDLATTEAHTRAKELFLERRYSDAMGILPRTSAPERAVLRSLGRGDTSQRAIKSLDRATLRFYISAFQSAAFNSVLDQRLRAGTLDRLIEGDIACKHDSRGCFDVDATVAADPATAERLRSLEISPSGPMWSGTMKRASGSTLEIELGALDQLGVSTDQLTAFEDRAAQLIEGSRRALRVPLTFPEMEAGLDEHGPYIRVAFDLPRGSFATVALEEIMKVNPCASEPPDEEEHER